MDVYVNDPEFRSLLEAKGGVDATKVLHSGLRVYVEGGIFYHYVHICAPKGEH
jgi:hypothetical protein